MERLKRKLIFAAGGHASQLLRIMQDIAGDDADRRGGGMDALKTQFDQVLKEPRMKAYDTLAQQLSNLISVCRKALADQPHLEFLFNGLCASRAMTDILACSPYPQFRKLFQDISFDPAVSARELESQLAPGGTNT